MAYIPDFEYDIFISYAHVDNMVSRGETEGWVNQFYKELNDLLIRRAGRPEIVKIWYDERKIDGNVLFDQSIEKGIKKSAIMICLNSPGYVASDYCKQELVTFYEKAQSEKAGLNIGDNSRIIHVLLNNIPINEWLPEFGGRTGFPFHTAENTESLGDPVDTISPEFFTQIKKVRDKVWQLLNEFPKDQLDTTSTEDNKDAFTIFMGEVSDTLRIPRKRTIAELERKGFKVITGIPPPDEAVAHEHETNEALGKADLAVHLLDEIPGREIIGDSIICYPQKQAELALKTAKSQMIWLPAETNFEEIDDKDYKLFLENLESGKSGSKSFEYIRGSKSTLAQEIIDFAEQIKSRQAVKIAETGKFSVLLDTHLNDQLYAYDLSRVLLENSIQPFINPEEDDPRKNMDSLEARIRQVRKLIFIYGNVSKEWVLERMNAAIRLILNNNYPIDDFFIYMAPPRKDANEITSIQKFLKINIVDSSKNSMPDKTVIQQFISNLKTAGI